VFTKKSYLSIWVSLIALIPAILLDILLVPSLGAAGAAIAIAVAYFFFFTARTYFSGKYWIKLPVTKHYVVFLFLLAGAFLNLFQLPGMLFINCVWLLLTLALQQSTVRQLWRFWRQQASQKKK
jgi:O-antigen/teichoic acid export membrane protein